MGKNDPYILEVSWGCPSEKYPLNGLFQWDQAAALRSTGRKVVFLALDMRSFRRWRKWGVNHFFRDDIPVYEYNFPFGPFSPETKYRIQDHGFERSMERIVAVHDMPACVHFHGVMEAISGMKYCADHGIPYVITEHITPVREGERVHERMTKAYSHADRIICVSNRLASDINDAYGAKTDAVIPNIVDLSLFRPDTGREPDMGIGRRDEEVFEFLSAAGLNHGKGFDVLLNAFAQLVRDTDRPIHLTVMGDGAIMDELTGLRDSLGLSDRVTFTGAYVRPEFAVKLHASDCFVLASRSETFGIVYVEAMAAGVPVIATRCGGPEDFVDDSCGVLVPVDDTEALESAMEHMMETADRYDGIRISEDTCSKFSPGAVAEALGAVIDEAIAEHR